MYQLKALFMGFDNDTIASLAREGFTPVEVHGSLVVALSECPNSNRYIMPRTTTGRVLVAVEGEESAEGGNSEIFCGLDGERLTASSRDDSAGIARFWLDRDFVLVRYDANENRATILEVAALRVPSRNMVVLDGMVLYEGPFDGKLPVEMSRFHKAVAAARLKALAAAKGSIGVYYAAPPIAPQRPVAAPVAARQDAMSAPPARTGKPTRRGGHSPRRSHVPVAPAEAEAHAEQRQLVPVAAPATTEPTPR